jgi:hypothetical protein
MSRRGSGNNRLLGDGRGTPGAPHFFCFWANGDGQGPSPHQNDTVSGNDGRVEQGNGTDFIADSVCRL